MRANAYEVIFPRVVVWVDEVLVWVGCMKNGSGTCTVRTK